MWSLFFTLLALLIITRWLLSSFLTRLLRMYGMITPPHYSTTTTYSHSEAPQIVSFGILGASRIAPTALVYPLRWIPNTRAYAIAARQELRAVQFAKQYSIPHVLATYHGLLHDPHITTVYISTPNGLHFMWAKAALEAGKHVLVEKPLACNERQARELIACAEKNDKLIMEAIHTFHHPAMLRARDIIRNGEIGSICEMTCTMKSSIPYTDIRHNCAGTDSTLGGGAMMDNGVYCIHAIQFLSDSYVKTVMNAHATQQFPGVDARMDTTLDFGTFIARVMCAIDECSPCSFIPTCVVQGSCGTLTIHNFVLPHLWHMLTITTVNGVTRRESHYGEGQTSWEYQLREFIHCLEEWQRRGGGGGGICRSRTGGPIDDPAAVLRVMDDIYEIAGVKR